MWRHFRLRPGNLASSVTAFLPSVPTPPLKTAVAAAGGIVPLPPDRESGKRERERDQLFV